MVRGRASRRAFGTAPPARTTGGRAAVRRSLSLNMTTNAGGWSSAVAEAVLALRTDAAPSGDNFDREIFNFFGVLAAAIIDADESALRLAVEACSTLLEEPAAGQRRRADPAEMARQLAFIAIKIIERSPSRYAVGRAEGVPSDT